MLVSLALCCCWCAAVASLICSPRLLARCCFSLSLSLSSAQLLPPVCCSEPPPQPQLPPSPAATPPPLKASLQSDRTRTQQSTAGMQARGGARARARREGEREAAADSVSSRCPSAAASLTRLHPPLAHSHSHCCTHTAHCKHTHARCARFAVLARDRFASPVPIGSLVPLSSVPSSDGSRLAITLCVLAQPPSHPVRMCLRPLCH